MSWGDDCKAEREARPSAAPQSSGYLRHGKHRAEGREEGAHILVGNGACRQAAIRYWGKKPADHPSASFEGLVHRGNHLLQRYVHAVGGAAARFAYLDRASSMETLWRVEDSPCVSHHPYGLMSDTHVQIVLNALWREEHGAGCPWSWR